MRLIELGCNWLWQYAIETTIFEPALYREVPPRSGRLNGYLQGTALAVLRCGRKPLEWQQLADRWDALAELLAMTEAEFSGRLLIGPADVARWRAEPIDALCWGVLAVAGFDFLVREPADLERLPGLFERGVRVFQIVASSSSLLGGSVTAGDDRGLTDLGRAFLTSLAALGLGNGERPRPVVDLTGLNARSRADVLDWAETRSGSEGRPLIMMLSGLDPERASQSGDLRRLRSSGVVIALTPASPRFPTVDAFKSEIEAIAAVPFLGQVGYEGIAIGTEFLGTEQMVPGLEEVALITRWLGRAFDPEIARAIFSGNASKLLMSAAGVAPPTSTG